MSPPSKQATQAVYLLPLTDDGAPDLQGEYIYLPPPSEPAYIVRFAIEGTSSICREGSLWVNIPAKDAQFDRNKFTEYQLSPDFNRTIQIDVPIHAAGAFAFYTTYTPLPDFSTKPVPVPGPTRTKTYYIDVSPKLSLQGSPLPIDALSIFSIISKFMGKYPDNWDKHLHGIGERGYNMVHFTPLMKRGASNSPYSLADQLSFDADHFPKGEKDVAAMIKKMEEEYGLLGLTDVVWNHTAPESKWLQDHPEAGYNLETAPWLESALVLDDALLDFSRKLGSLDLPTTLNNVDDLLKIMETLKSRVLGGASLWEYYVLHVERDTKEIVDSWMNGKVNTPENDPAKLASDGGEDAKSWPLKRQADWLVEHAMIGGDRMGERYRRRMDPKTAAALLTSLVGHFDVSADSSKQAAADTIRGLLNDLNVNFYREYDADVGEIMEQIFNRVKYIRLDDHGPKLGAITEENPLVESYFTRLPMNATTEKHDSRALALVNNGWIWAADAMKDNAGSSSRAYLRREVIVWSDCVKLRYGNGPDDNPFLWDHMAKYTRLMAKYFAGFRVDNCHSTPIHLAEFMLDEARKVRANLAVFAELFTGSEQMDFVFVERLGISALIREAMQAWSTGELSRLVHRHGGRPIGSFEVDEVTNAEKAATAEYANGSVNGHPTQTARPREMIRRIRQSPVHALFMDCTHDNELPTEKRDARDTLPNAALVAMCACASGSVMGYDEIYPKQIELVHETRLYSSPYSSHRQLEVSAGEGGFGGIKKLLNQIHVLMGKDGYDETHIHHEGEYITVHRVHPRSRKGYFLIAHTAFPGYGNGNGGFSPTYLTGTKARLLGSWLLEVDVSEEAKSKAIGDKTTLRGLPSRTHEMPGVNIEAKGEDTIITVRDRFPPGSIALFETWIPGAEHSEGLDKFVTTGAREAFKNLDLVDLNFVLYRCDAEERDWSGGSDGVYEIPNYGPLVYAGLQGWWSVLRDVVKGNELGHPVCDHLRQGQWALDYCFGRLERQSKKETSQGLAEPAQWLRERFDAIRKIPNFLLPRYFALVVQTAYAAAWDRGTELLNDNVRNGQGLLRSLALVSVQMTGYVDSASLWSDKSVPSLSAGLPHFSTSWARCWGRDIFISLRGLYLGTGRFADAREHILAFASVLKHGMIPNLLSDGANPRYNSRDSIWFFLQNIQDYTKLAPQGMDILQEKVKRRFLPYDDTWFEHTDPRAYSKESTVEEVVQEALQRHAQGLRFREANAGQGLDMQMSDEGFNIDIKVDWDTGMIFGGNQSNCGTWMDKMGESEKAGSKGVPGTPRDGAAVEITGMLYSTLRWLSTLHSRNQYRYAGVALPSSTSSISFADWAARIKSNFERCYYIPLDPADDANFDVNPAIVNRRGIYKDLYRAGKEYEDYQLRPNFSIAMCVAPELFPPERALGALEIADQVLRGPTGMRTLDPTDLNYRPFYNNSEDSTEFHTSKGRNYHQGPEWLWPTGFFLRALLRFDLMRRKTWEEKVEAYQQITRRLRGCVDMIRASPWAGLAELTNKDGAHCADSSPTQAWSAGCLIDLFHDAREFRAQENLGSSA